MRKITIVTVCLEDFFYVGSHYYGFNQLAPHFDVIDWKCVLSGDFKSGDFFARRIRKDGVYVNWSLIHREPNGIYDAMNKGLDYIDTGFIMFLNPKDCLLKMLDFAYAPINIGFYRTVDSELVSLGKRPDNTICHQALIMNVTLLKEYMYFDTELQIYSDQLAFHESSKRYRPKVSNFLVHFDDGGVSSKHSFIKFLDWLRLFWKTDFANKKMLVIGQLRKKIGFSHTAICKDR